MFQNNKGRTAVVQQYRSTSGNHRVWPIVRQCFHINTRIIGVQYLDSHHQATSGEISNRWTESQGSKQVNFSNNVDKYNIVFIPSFEVRHPFEEFAIGSAFRLERLEYDKGNHCKEDVNSMKCPGDPFERSWFLLEAQPLPFQ